MRRAALAIVIMAAVSCTPVAREPTREVTGAGRVVEGREGDFVPRELDYDFLVPGPVAAGTYRTRLFVAPFTLAFDDTQWQSLLAETRYDIVLLDNDVPAEILPREERRQVSILRPDRILTDPFADGLTLTFEEPSVTAEIPDDLGAALRAFDHVTWTSPEPRRVGGRAAVSFEGSLTELPEAADDAALCADDERRCQLLLTTPTIYYGFGEGRRVRIWIIDDGPGAPVVVMADARSEEFDEFLPRVERLLDGLTFAS